tara:strand:- start:1411 stop:1938 length:528 start_codon:yes stop_codon:yes gene_type:complete
MTILPIVWAPDPILKTKCSPVSAVDDTIIKLMDDMLDTMYQAPGVGLAAPQIGVKKRIIVVDCSSKDENRAPLRMINPELVSVSDEETISEEGCLSLPGHYANISRPAEVKVSYLDEAAENRLVEVSGLLSVCIQHEIDHLNGILFIDHLSSLKRNMILKKMVKAKKERMGDSYE